MVYLAAGLVMTGSGLLVYSWLGRRFGGRSWLSRSEEQAKSHGEDQIDKREHQDDKSAHLQKAHEPQANSSLPTKVNYQQAANFITTDNANNSSVVNRKDPRKASARGGTIRPLGSEMSASAASLMPPPPRPTPRSSNTLKAPPRPSGTLAPPPSTASTLRAPPSSSSTSLSPTTSTLAPSARPSRKVLLAPGHSPLDWAHLTSNPPSPTFLRGRSIPTDRLIRVPPSLLKSHNGRKGQDAWAAFQGKVFNLTPYVDFHPGGRGELMRGVGKDGGVMEKLFNEVHPWVNWEGMLAECLIGILVGEGQGEEEESMEEMD